MPRICRPRSRLFGFGIGFERLEGRQLLAALVVTGVEDSGPGSLRQAILDANASLAPSSTIEFAIPGLGMHTIDLLSPLPMITASVDIDATTELGYGGRPVVAIDGSDAGAGDGLYFPYNSTSSVIGLAIERFQGNGISTDSAVVDISKDFIGVDPTSAANAGNQGAGIRLFSGNGSVIGGTPDDANVIGGNGGDGINVSLTSNVQITNNFIGTDDTGLTNRGNVGNGVTIEDYTSNTYVGSNVIANNGGLAISDQNYFQYLPTVIGPNLESNNGTQLSDVVVSASTAVVTGSTGQLQTFSYTLTNQGLGAATNVNLTLFSENYSQGIDTYIPPSVFQFVSASTTLGTINPNAALNGFDASQLLQIDSLPSGASATVTVTISLANSGSDSLNAYATSNPPYTNFLSSASTTITTTGTVDLAVAALPVPDLAKIGSPLAFTFLVTNRDARYMTLPNLTLALPDPSAATVVSVSTSLGTLTQVAGQPQVYTGTLVTPAPDYIYPADLIGLAPGASATVTVVLIPTRSGPLHVALATSAPQNDDPDPANGLAIAGVPASLSPTVTSATLPPGTGAIGSVAIGFDAPLNRSRAENVRNYSLTANGHTIGIRAATYDGTTGGVTLRLARFISRRGAAISLRIKSTHPSGLTATDGSTLLGGTTSKTLDRVGSVVGAQAKRTSRK